MVDTLPSFGKNNHLKGHFEGDSFLHAQGAHHHHKLFIYWMMQTKRKTKKSSSRAWQYKHKQSYKMFPSDSDLLLLNRFFISSI